jgi:ERCC4-type nuclease
VEIAVDIHERRSGVPNRLAELGVRIAVCHLPIGDYALGDVAIVERKTARGLHHSLIDGRLWPQLGRLRKTALWPYLLIEGSSMYDGPLSAEAVRGLILSVTDLGVTVIYSSNPHESAEWIRRIARRRLDERRRVDRPAYAQRPQRDPHVPPPEQALAAAPGISTTTARALLAEFGSLINVLLASPAELRRIPGVGPNRCRAIQELATNH